MCAQAHTHAHLSTVPGDPGKGLLYSIAVWIGWWINQSEWSACFSCQWWNDLLPSGTKRTNSAMGTGQIPPHNAGCLLLCWTALANRTKTIHASMRMFAQMQYNWEKAIGDQSGRFAYREGVKDICVRNSRSPVPSVPPFTAASYSS